MFILHVDDKDLEDLADKTCHEFLKAGDLKEICRYRGFNPAKTDKDSLAAFVAARLLEPIGLEQAMSSLEKRFLEILHFIAYQDRLVYVRELAKSLQPGRGSHSADHRGNFRELTEGLLNRGLVLIRDTDWADYSSESRFARIALFVPKAFRPFLPPYPILTLPLTERAETRSIQTFGRNALAIYARWRGQTPPRSRSGSRPPDTSGTSSTKESQAEFGPTETNEAWLEMIDAPNANPTPADVATFNEAHRQETHPTPKPNSPRDILRQAASAFRIRDGRLEFADLTVPSLETFTDKLRTLWIRAATTSIRTYHSKEAFGFAAYVLGRLPPGQGCLPSGLAAAVEPIADLDPPDMTRFLEDGFTAGLLTRGGRIGAACYTIPQTTSEEDKPFVFTAVDQKIRIDLERTGFAPLLELATISETEIFDGALYLSPDIPRMGRIFPKLKEIPSFGRATVAAKGYGRAWLHVKNRYGKLYLHQDLIVLKVDDLGLRTQLEMKFANLSPLGGPFLAIPRAMAGEIEQFARKEGFSPRRVS